MSTAIRISSDAQTTPTDPLLQKAMLKQFADPLELYMILARLTEEPTHWNSRHWTQTSKPIFGCVHVKANDDLFLIQVSEEVDCLSSSSGRTTNKDKLHLSGDSGNTTVRPWTNVFILDTISRSQKGYPRTNLQAMERKVENEKPGTSAFSICPAPPVSPTPNTKVAHASHGKAGALRKCQTLHGLSLPFSTDRGMTCFQSGEERGPDGPSGSANLPQPKGDRPNSFVGHFSRLQGSSVDRPRISSNANQSYCLTPPLRFGPCSGNSEPQSSPITDTSKIEYRSNELSPIIHISKPPHLSYPDICKRPHRATSKRKSINHLTKLIHGPLSLKARSRKQKK
ncbi:hypothetical protein Ancab_025457 [Ancistrocladus abbreviatus]